MRFYNCFFAKILNNKKGTPFERPFWFCEILYYSPFKVEMK